MTRKFPFEYVGDMSFGPIYRPIAKVSFESLKTHIWIETWMVVDTGADFTLLPKYLANDLAISLKEDCREDNISGVGGEQGIYFVKKKVVAKIGDMVRQVPIAFFDSNEMPALLGRLGFMETFDVEFLKSKSILFKE